MLLFRAASRALITTLLVAVSVVAARAAVPRARLSADLAAHLAAGSQAIDVIVHGNRAEVDALARRYNVVVKKYMKSGAVLRVTAGQLAAIADDGTQDHLSADIAIRSSADVVAESIGADQVWAGSGEVAGLSGNGIGVAVIDSGVDFRHAALRQRVVASRDFTGGDGSDGYGHGTHVAALIAGARLGEYRGIAYGASLINLRVLDGRGNGQASDVIEAIDWAIDNRGAYNIRVINLSVGAPVLQPYRDDPLCEAVERAVAAGIVVIASAGNGGVTAEGRTVYGSITSPGNDPSAITVGALDLHGTPQRSDDTVAGYSAKGPTMYDLVLKPDLVAPGSGVVSAEAAGSYLAATHPERHVSGSGATGYLQLSGTSMAAGVVSGTVALMLERRPGLGPRLAKAVLQMTSSFVGTVAPFQVVLGSLNALLATRSVLQPGAHDAPSTPIVMMEEHASEDTAFNSSLLVLDGSFISDPRTESIVWDIQSTLIVSNAYALSDAEWHTGQNVSDESDSTRNRRVTAASIAWDATQLLAANLLEADSIVWDVQTPQNVARGSIVWDWRTRTVSANESAASIR